MTLDEFTHILETYGANESRWPHESRDECQNFIQSNPRAQELLLSFSELDNTLNAIPQPHFPGLEQRVLTQYLPERQKHVLDKLISWLLPESNSFNALWLPALTACLPLVFGIVVGNFYSFGYDIEVDGFQYWDDELIMLSFNDYSGSQP